MHRMRSDPVRIKAVLDAFKFFYGVTDRLRCLLPEIMSGNTIDNGISRATLAKSHNRRAAGLGLERSDSEIFFGSK